MFEAGDFLNIFLRFLTKMIPIKKLVFISLIVLKDIHQKHPNKEQMYKFKIESRGLEQRVTLPKINLQRVLNGINLFYKNLYPR